MLLHRFPLIQAAQQTSGRFGVVRKAFSSTPPPNAITTATRTRRRLLPGHLQRSSPHARQPRLSAPPKQTKTRTLSTTGGGISNNNTYYSLTQTISQFLSKPRSIPIPRWITPQSSQITFSECFGHASFVVVAISYAVDDFLMLRIIAVIGSTSMLVFTYFHPHGRILWLPFKWNLLFIAINGYRIFHVYYSRYAANTFMPKELLERYEKSFFLMDKVDYYRLMRIAEIEDYQKGDLIVAQCERVPVVRMVLQGKIRVLRDGKLTYMLQENNFISEAGIHIGLLLPGSIESCGSIVADTDTVRVLCWDRTELVHLMDIHEGLRRSLKAIMSWDIVRKLKAQRSLLTEHLITDPDEWTLLRNQQTTHRYAALLQAVLQSDQLRHFAKHLMRYRTIHHIDDATHAIALKQCGWTEEEFAAGKRRVVEDEEELLLGKEQVWGVRDWKWYLRDLYMRLTG